MAKKFHDLLFANQPSEGGSRFRAVTTSTRCGQAGANADKLKTAVDNGEGAVEGGRRHQRG